jgi:AcrR family transcriptional regulator
MYLDAVNMTCHDATMDREPPRDSYHHGDLRRALLEAAAALVAERGVEGLTLREVARRAGVSHAAPYHHFADLSDMVTALAAEGLSRLRDEQRAIAARPGPAPERIRALGRAYVRFALDDPSRFRLIWRPELRGDAGPTAVDEAGAESYAPLVRAIAAGQAAGELVEGETADLALGAWAAVHGLAMLLVDGPLRSQVSDWSEAESRADAVVTVVLDGLRRRPDGGRGGPERS